MGALTSGLFMGGFLGREDGAGRGPPTTGCKLGPVAGSVSGRGVQGGLVVVVVGGGLRVPVGPGGGRGSLGVVSGTTTCLSGCMGLL